MTDSIIFDFASIAAAIKPDQVIVCEACEDGGWECYGIGIGDPHFRECRKCGNPEGHPSP